MGSPVPVLIDSRRTFWSPAGSASALCGLGVVQPSSELATPGLDGATALVRSLVPAAPEHTGARAVGARTADATGRT